MKDQTYNDLEFINRSVRRVYVGKERFKVPWTRARRLHQQGYAILIESRFADGPYYLELTDKGRNYIRNFRDMWGE